MVSWDSSNIIITIIIINNMMLMMNNDDDDGDDINNNKDESDKYSDNDNEKGRDTPWWDNSETIGFYRINVHKFLLKKTYFAE